MKKTFLVLVLATSVAAFAQHGRPAGAGPGMGSSAGSSMGSGAGNSMGRGAQGGMPGDVNTSARGSSANAGSAAGHGKTTDQLLSQNTKLSSQLQGMLPNGMTAQQACSGYKNLGGCVAAIHVANNLGISFDDLKAKTTGDGSVSLGKAIKDLNPNVDAKQEIKKAKGQAKADLKGSNS